MKKGLLLISVIILVSALILSSCAPAPAPAPKPSTAPSPAPAAGQKPFDLEIYSSAAGGTTYILSLGLAKIISRHSDWLRATSTEAQGGNFNILDSDTPEKRAKRLFILGDTTYWQALAGDPPLTKKYTDLRQVLNAIEARDSLITLDSNIKTPQDLIGKKVFIGTIGSVSGINYELCLNAWGITDKVKITRGAYQAAAQALQDGMIDATYCPIPQGTPNGPQFWKPVGPMEEVMLMKQAYWIDIDKDTGEKIKAKYGYPYRTNIIPKDSIAKGTPNRDSWAIQQFVNWACYKDLPDDVVREVVRISVEYWKEFAEFHAAGQCMDPKSMANRFNIQSENELHPAALKYFKEKGLR